MPFLLFINSVNAEKLRNKKNSNYFLLKLNVNTTILQIKCIVNSLQCFSCLPPTSINNSNNVFLLCSEQFFMKLAGFLKADINCNQVKTAAKIQKTALLFCSINPSNHVIPRKEAASSKRSCIFLKYNSKLQHSSIRLPPVVQTGRRYSGTSSKCIKLRFSRSLY